MVPFNHPALFGIVSKNFLTEAFLNKPIEVPCVIFPLPSVHLRENFAGNRNVS